MHFAPIPSLPPLSPAEAQTSEMHRVPVGPSHSPAALGTSCRPGLRRACSCLWLEPSTLRAEEGYARLVFLPRSYTAPFCFQQAGVRSPGFQAPLLWKQAQSSSLPAAPQVSEHPYKWPLAPVNE